MVFDAVLILIEIKYSGSEKNVYIYIYLHEVYSVVFKIVL